MSEQPDTTTKNDNAEGHQQHQYVTETAGLHSDKENRLNEGRKAGEGNSAQRDVSVTGESRGTSDEPPRKRTKTSTLLRNLPQTSCLRCKEKKIKCEPSSVVEGICKKCESGHHECQYQIPREKQQNAKWKRRIDRLEQTLSNLRSSATGGALSDSPTAYVDSIHEEDTQTKEARVDRLEQTLLHYAELENQKSDNFVSNRGNVAAYALNPLQHLPTDSLLRGSQNKSYLDVVDQGILDLGKAHALLQEYKIISHNFPYVVLSVDSSVSTLRRENPMLLLAVCAVAAWKDREHQATLEKAYLEELAARMVVKGEQTIDMLQGLLVHLSWCHFHLKSSYRLTSLAISLVTTLGINHRPTPPGRQNLGVAFPFPNGVPPLSVPAKSWSPAARRAYIGAYVICSTYAHALRKPSTLKYTPYLEDCALSLLRDSGFPSDALLIHHVRLAHHAETINDTFDYDFSRSVSTPPDSQLHFYMRSFSTALSHIESQIPPHVATNPLLTTALLLVAAYTHEVGLHGLRPNDTLSLPRTTILIDCLGAVKHVLDAIAALSDLDFRTLLGFNWARIHYALSLAVELSLGVASPSWSVEGVRSVLALETYVDVFVARLDGLSAMVRKKDGEWDWFAFLAAHWRELRRKYAEGMGNKGVVVPGGATMAELEEGWLGLGDMDFMPNEWLWMASDGGL